jgi:hypothetical protein
MINRKEGKWVGHILRRNCLVKSVIKGKIEVMRRRGIRRLQRLDGLKETRGYCKLKEEALDRAVYRTRLLNYMNLLQGRLHKWNMTPCSLEGV